MSGDDVPAQQPRQHEPPRRGSSGVEVFKAVLDFVSKCFYPAIIVAVIILLQPALSQIDLKGLLARLQSAKAGGYEFTFNQAEDVGAATAPLNSKIADLKREVASLSGALRTLQIRTGMAGEAMVVPRPEGAEAAAPAAAEGSIARNSRYTVLVFNSSKGRSTAEKITDALLNAGYKSSRTETDFAELGDTYPAGTVYMTHAAAADAAYPAITKLITPLLGSGVDLKVQQKASDLRRGDVQIMVF
jgi:hypothetical protein